MWDRDSLWRATGLDIVAAIGMGLEVEINNLTDGSFWPCLKGAKTGGIRLIELSVMRGLSMSVFAWSLPQGTDTTSNRHIPPLEKWLDIGQAMLFKLITFHI